MDNFKDLLITKLKSINLLLTDEQLDKFEKYYCILKEYNEHTNLVSNTDAELVVVKHFVDSLSIVLLKEYLPKNKPLSIIDIGIGGGFPGIPILIANPEWKLCAVDSIGKKTNFIELLVEKLELSDRVEIHNRRAEELAFDVNFREKFDICTSRAVSELNTLCEYCMPFVKNNGFLLAYKGKQALDEIENAKNAIKILKGKLVKIAFYNLPDVENSERNLVLIEKTGIIDTKYPRQRGLPKKKPL